VLPRDDKVKIKIFLQRTFFVFNEASNLPDTGTLNEESPYLYNFSID
jgi:hypothetical protein